MNFAGIRDKFLICLRKSGVQPGGVAKMPAAEVEVCDICKKNVQDDEEGLLCDKCNTWKHRICLSMAQKTYLKLNKSTELWYCDKCKNAGKSAKKQAPTETYTLGDVMAKLDEMDKKHNVLLEKFNEQLKINNDLQEELKLIKQQLNKKEQNELKNNLIIQGVPYKDNENLGDLITKIGQNLEVPLGRNYTAFRMGKDSSKNSAIKVIFEEEKTKAMLMKSKKRFQLNSSHLGFATNCKVFLNHDLTKANVRLYKAARQFKNEEGFKYIWMNNGNVLLRKDDNSKVMVVNSEEQLKN